MIRYLYKWLPVQMTTSKKDLLPFLLNIEVCRLTRCTATNFYSPKSWCIFHLAKLCTSIQSTTRSPESWIQLIMLIVDIMQYITHNMPPLWPIQNFSQKISRVFACRHLCRHWFSHSNWLLNCMVKYWIALLPQCRLQSVCILDHWHIISIDKRRTR